VNATPPAPRKLRRLAPAALAIFLLGACGSGKGVETEVKGVSYERPAPTTTTTVHVEPAATPSTTMAPAPTTTVAPPPPPPPPPPPDTAPAPTTGVVSGGYRSPDGDGTIRVSLLRPDGSVADARDLGGAGGPFSFDTAPGTYRLEISDAGPAVDGATTRTQSQVVTRTDSFTLEAGGAVRFECDISTGCAGVMG
jgi:hypothetical protein